MKQWQISKLTKKKMEDVNDKKILFHFYDGQAGRIETWLVIIGALHISRFEDCRTNHFFYIENGHLQYVNTDAELEICYLLNEGFKPVEIIEDRVNG